MIAAVRAEDRRLRHVEVRSQDEESRAQLLEGFVSLQKLPEPTLHPGSRITRPENEQISEFEIVQKLAQRESILGFDVLILAVAGIGNGPYAAARENLLARAQVHRVPHASNVPADSADMAPKDGRCMNSRKARLASETRFEDLLNLVAGGREQRIDCACGRADQQADLPRLGLGAGAESRCEGKTTRFECASHP